MKILIIQIALSAFLLISCGGSNSSDPQAKGSDHFRSEDTPTSRLQAAQNHPEFAGLVQSMTCDATAKTVTGVVYETRLNVKYPFLDSSEVCGTDVKLFIDSHTGLLMWWQDCVRGIGHMTYKRETTEYSISGNTLTIADLATLNAGFGQSSFQVNLQGATHQGTLGRASQKQLRNSTGESLYSTFCPTEQSLVQ